MMPVEFANPRSTLRTTPEVQDRNDERADRCNEGELTDADRSGQAAYVDAIDVITILQAKAGTALAHWSNGRWTPRPSGSSARGHRGGANPAAVGGPRVVSGSMVEAAPVPHLSG